MNLHLSHIRAATNVGRVTDQERRWLIMAKKKATKKKAAKKK